MTPLSANNRLIRTGSPALILLFLFSTILSTIIHNKFNILILLFIYLILGTILILIIYQAYLKTQNIFYDEENMYLKGYNYNKTYAIKFIKIKKLTLRQNRFELLGFRFVEYKIEYLDDNHNLQSIQFFINSDSKVLTDFENKVIGLNPYFKAEHWHINID
jgi:hypothetical protein